MGVVALSWELSPGVYHTPRTKGPTRCVLGHRIGCGSLKSAPGVFPHVTSEVGKCPQCQHLTSVCHGLGTGTVMQIKWEFHSVSG